MLGQQKPQNPFLDPWGVPGLPLSPAVGRFFSTRTYWKLVVFQYGQTVYIVARPWHVYLGSEIVNKNHSTGGFYLALSPHFHSRDITFAVENYFKPQ